MSNEGKKGPNLLPDIELLQEISESLPDPIPNVWPWWGDHMMRALFHRAVTREAAAALYLLG